ncbi:Protein kinase domain [Trypanosoma vivax]|uniref:Protein kinase domain-containing protein n=1 Tax=Trypanosoma vivax (strain Y486) TaxID=1055687 RepID=G0U9U8_TRYVY|nr:Protein kinase domain [Trypanosoma vivax]CCC52579.1 putative protein kinase [Trypanosoma vivax Y486]
MPPGASPVLGSIGCTMSNDTIQRERCSKGGVECQKKGFAIGASSTEAAHSTVTSYVVSRGTEGVKQEDIWTKRQGRSGTQEQLRRVHLISEFEKLYEVRKQLGSGGYSIVFEVVDRKTMERKAAKFVLGKEKQREAQCEAYANQAERNNPTPADMKNSALYSNGNKNTFRPPGPVLTEAMVREIAVSLTVQHKNLLDTTEVFVHDVDDLQRRLKPHVPRLTLTPLPPHKGGAKRNFVPRSSSNSSSCKQWAGSDPRVDENGCATTMKQSSWGSPNSNRERKCTSDTNSHTADKILALLREGKVKCILIMNLLSGRDLFFLISRGPLDEETAAAYLFDLFLALQHLHKHRIIHRDVKVENMVLDSDGRVHLVDYGFCERIEPPKESNDRPGLGGRGAKQGKSSADNDAPLTQFCGSHHYVAPEVIRSAFYAQQANGSYDPKSPSGPRCINLPPISNGPSHVPTPSGFAAAYMSPNSDIRGMQSPMSPLELPRSFERQHIGYGLSADVWSSGVVMYVLLHSAFPFHDEHRSRLLKLIMSNSKPPQVSPFLSESAKDLLYKLLTHDTQKRPTVNEVLEHQWFVKQLGPKRIKKMMDST